MWDINYGDMRCPKCGHIGLVPNGGFDVACPECEEDFSIEDIEE